MGHIYIYIVIYIKHFILSFINNITWVEASIRRVEMGFYPLSGGARNYFRPSAINCRCHQHPSGHALFQVSTEAR